MSAIADRRYPQITRWFRHDHLSGPPEHVSAFCAELVVKVLAEIPEENSEESSELAVGLRKLLEAKDCFVRAAIAGRE